MAEGGRWWEVEPPPQGPSEVNKYVDRCLEFLLAPEPDAPMCRIAAKSLRADCGDSAECDSCGLAVDRVARVRNPYCTSHAFHLCSECWPDGTRSN